MIEGDIESLEERVSELTIVIKSLIGIIVPKVMEHAEDCRNAQREVVKKDGWYPDHCGCSVELINELGGRDYKAVLDEKEIKELMKEFNYQKKATKSKKVKVKVAKTKKVKVKIG